jgi:hypothetical protein
MAETVFSVILKEVDAQIEQQQGHLTNGGPSDYAKYRESVGVLRGLYSVRQYVEGLSRNYMEDDDE